MTNEPLILPLQTEQLAVVQVNDHGATQPTPTEDQQQVSDTVFSRQEQEAVAMLLTAQMGLGLLHNLAVDAAKSEEFEEKARKKPRPGEEQ